MAHLKSTNLLHSYPFTLLTYGIWAVDTWWICCRLYQRWEVCGEEEILQGSRVFHKMEATLTGGWSQCHFFAFFRWSSATCRPESPESISTQIHNLETRFYKFIGRCASHQNMLHWNRVSIPACDTLGRPPVTLLVGALVGNLLTPLNSVKLSRNHASKCPALLL